MLYTFIILSTVITLPSAISKSYSSSFQHVSACRCSLMKVLLQCCMNLKWTLISHVTYKKTVTRVSLVETPTKWLLSRHYSVWLMHMHIEFPASNISVILLQTTFQIMKILVAKCVTCYVLQTYWFGNFTTVQTVIRNCDNLTYTVYAAALS